MVRCELVVRVWTHGVVESCTGRAQHASRRLSVCLCLRVHVCMCRCVCVVVGRWAINRQSSAVAARMRSAALTERAVNVNRRTDGQTDRVTWQRHTQGPPAGHRHVVLSSRWNLHGAMEPRSPIYKISYDLSYDYREFIVRSTYDSDLKRAEISLRNIVS